MRPWLQVLVKHLESSEIQAVSMFWKLKVKVSDHPSDPGPKARRQTQKKARQEIAGDTATLSDCKGLPADIWVIRWTIEGHIWWCFLKLEVQILFHVVPISRRVLYFLIHLLIHICHPRRPERGSVANRLFKSEQFKFQAQKENSKKKWQPFRAGRHWRKNEKQPHMAIGLMRIKGGSVLYPKSPHPGSLHFLGHHECFAFHLWQHFSNVIPYIHVGLAHTTQPTQTQPTTQPGHWWLNMFRCSSNSSWSPCDRNPKQITGMEIKKTSTGNSSKSERKSANSNNNEL